MADERTRGVYGTPYDDTLNVQRAKDSHAHEFVQCTMHNLHCTRTNLRAHAKLGCFGNLDVRGQLGYPSCPKSSLANSEIQVESRIMESILVFGGEIPLETWKLVKIQVRKNFAVYTPPKTVQVLP